jgi:hypothetical protein
VLIACLVMCKAQTIPASCHEHYMAHLKARIHSFHAESTCRHRKTRAKPPCQRAGTKHGKETKLKAAHTRVQNEFVLPGPIPTICGGRIRGLQAVAKDAVIDGTPPGHSPWAVSCDGHKQHCRTIKRGHFKGQSGMEEECMQSTSVMPEKANAVLHGRDSVKYHLCECGPCKPDRRSITMQSPSSTPSYR